MASKPSLRLATSRDAVPIARLLTASLNNGIEAQFTINRFRLMEHIKSTIADTDGLAIVATQGTTVVGCFMAELQQHAYCKGYMAVQLGAYIDPSVRGGSTFVAMLDQYIAWAKEKPDVLFTGFSIGQLGATTPYIRNLLAKRGFVKSSEDYYKL